MMNIKMTVMIHAVNFYVVNFGTKSCTSCYLDMEWTEEKDRDTLRKYMSSTLQWFKLFKLSKVS